MATAVANHLILELDYAPWVGSLVAAIFFLGFFTFALLFGHKADQHGPRKVIMLSWTSSLVLGGLCLIPIDSTARLGLFMVWRFFDGGANGIFWPTIQGYSVYANKISQKKKLEFLGKYNFSWNFGFFLGMAGGAIIVYFTQSNFQIFYVSFILTLMGTALGYWGLKSIPKSLQKPEEVKTLPINSDLPDATDGPKQESLLRKFEQLPIHLLVLMLLVHSMSDGAIVIILPLKVDGLGLGSHWVFILGMVKLLFQTISTTSMSHVRDRFILPVIYGVLFTMAIVWLIFVFADKIWIFVVLQGISGFMQGTIYALGMKLISYKAQASHSNRPYTYFQASMGTGRMIGPLNIGMGALHSQNTGVWIMIGYSAFAASLFFGNTRKLVETTSETDCDVCR